MSTINEPLPEKDLKTQEVDDATATARDEKQEASADTDNASTKTTAAELRTEWIQFITLCLCLFLAGWNDGTTGPLLPRIQEYYHLGYTALSTLFLLQCVGFIVGAFAALWLNEKIGFGKSLVFGALCQTVAYAIQAPAPPFPVLVVFAALNGFGMAIQDAQSNGFVAVMKHNPDRKMGVLHAVYGLGALVSPLIATQFAQLPRHWALHYVISSALALSTAVANGLVFRLKRQEDLLPPENPKSEVTSLSAELDGRNKYKQIFSLRVVHYLAFFILLYVGIELTIGGWIVTFILRERNGGPSSGYVSSGFYGGLMLGRVILLPVNEYVGEQRVIFIYGLIAAALDIVIWQVPHLVGDAVAASFTGLALGPMYPLIMNFASASIPRHLLTGSIGWIAGFGQVGSAAFPFVTGAMASRWDIRVLPPMIVAMIGVMLLLWVLAVLERRAQTKRDAEVASAATAP
ncbi:MFS general substrate transporter [Auricularia subglabra TFB-10046 SS5]|uniref:MFS general substrate transporter n=1 Tax=Auricularia subglabra (strain TFB-10046 / SS5) TaxID=717982 RepID=J0D248_AURST|nr:MFS general substrate transporter [Auricularia subglabra TFB-10046 SS5]